MHLRLFTPVKNNYLTIKEGFDEKLFMKLNPPFPPVRLIEFGGCEKGDIVHLRLNFLLFKQDWISEITHDQTNDQVFSFIDQGKKLPFFLKKWKHHHIVEKEDDNLSIIIDDIHYSTGFTFFDVLMYPVLWLQFAYRKPIYKKYFM